MLSNGIYRKHGQPREHCKNCYPMSRIAYRTVVDGNYLNIRKFCIKKFPCIWSANHYYTVFFTEETRHRHHTSRVSEPPIERTYQDITPNKTTEKLHYFSVIITSPLGNELILIGTFTVFLPVISASTPVTEATFLSKLKMAVY